MRSRIVTVSALAPLRLHALHIEIMDTPVPARFQTTRWSVVLRAGSTDDPRSAEALNQLCRNYWRPLYAFCRRDGRSITDAEDLTQGFLAQLLARDALRLADPARGKFRSFLISSFKNYVTDAHRHMQALRRGGSASHVPFDHTLSENELARLSGSESPEQAYDRQWAHDLVRRVTETLRAEYVASGKGEWFERVAGERAGTADYATLAVAFNSTEDAVKSFALRVRRRFRTLLEREIADTVTTPAEVAAEIAHLAQLLRA